MSLCECGCGETTKLVPKTIGARGYVKGQPLRFINGHNQRLNKGERHQHWKGAEASYMAIHNWIRREKPKTGECVLCGKTGKTDWANISGEYLRNLGDYRELCRSCHMKLDKGSPTIGAQLAKALEA